MKGKHDLVTETIKTYEKYAEEYCKAHLDVSEVKNIANLFMKILVGTKILDVGCGPGRHANYFSEHNFEVIGIDLSSAFVHIASEHISHATFIEMDMRNLHFPENTFDGIWVCASFLHIQKKKQKTLCFDLEKF